MATPLISIRHLIADSWNVYAKHWNRMMEVSLWLLLFPVIHLLLALTFSGLSPTVSFYVLGAIEILDGLFAVWITIRLMRMALARSPKEEGLIAHNFRIGWDAYLPFFLISLLTSLAILGGVALFFFPGVWLAIVLVFAPLLFLDENIRGTQALAASAQLVKGRWWATFVRIALPGIFFFMLMMFALSLINFVASLFIGYDNVNRVMEAVSQSAWAPITAETIKLQSVGMFLSRLPQALFLPIFIVALTKLYRSLKETR